MTHNLFDTPDDDLFDMPIRADGPSGRCRSRPTCCAPGPSGDLFGWSQNAGMGWDPSALGGKEFLMLSTHGGIRAPDGSPIALGYHTGHWEVGLLVEAAAACVQVGGRGAICRSVHGSVRRPIAGHDGDVRQPAVPQRRGDGLPPADPIAADPARRPGRRDLRQRTAGDDDGARGQRRSAVRPGPWRRDAAARPREKTPAASKPSACVSAHGELTLEAAAELGCRACASPGGGCQFLGTAATAQVVGEALGLSLGHAALAPSGQPIWLDMARRSARALMRPRGRAARPCVTFVTDAAIRNAMVVHAAFGGSTNLLLHLPAIAHAAGLRRPTAQEWADVNQAVPRLVDALPNGPRNHPTVEVFLAGGVPEVMLHLRRAGLLDTQRARRSAACTLDEQLDAWESSASAARAHAAARAQRRRSRRRDHVAGHGAGTRPDVDDLFSAWQPGARRDRSSRARRSIRR